MHFLVLRLLTELSETLASSGRWKLVSAAMIVLSGGFTFKVLTAPHEHHDAHHYAHMRVRNVRFPWGDGQTDLVDNIRGSPSH